jgi:Na+-transporting methylmalonyl-CoA/oxaloacetate decarboxylase gamma subunit
MKMTVLQQSLQLMAIGLPVMFGFIILLMLMTKLLVKIFPYKPDEE